ncbi:MAG TPA: nuclear transport factor 2 family protein [Kofleriaceae bacterium]|nr:nuclear transport factor 2 family protein [Kofleriaceae bacterium]
MTSRPKPPSRVLLVLAGMMTQLLGVGSLVLALASLPVVHDLHHGMQALAASVIAAIAALVCGTLVWRGRIVPLALAIGIDVGFGIVLPRGGSALGAMLKLLPADDAQTAETIVTAAAIGMFVAAVLCVLSIPSALALRRWAREQIAEGRPSAGSTLPGLGPERTSQRNATVMIRTAERQARSRPAVIAGVALTLIVVGVVVIAAAMGGGSAETAAGSGSGNGSGGGSGSGTGSGTRLAARGSGSGSGVAAAAAAAVADAGVADAPGAPSLDDFVAKWHDAIKGKPAELAAMFRAKSFAFGVEAHELTEGPAAIAAMIAHDAGDHRDVEVRFSQIGHEADVGWIAEELRVGGKSFVVTAVAELAGGKWTLAALHWASALPNADAYRTARDGSLPVPDAISDAHDTSPLADAMRTAFASKPSFVAARSSRPDAFNFGSAPGERIAGGDAIKKTFARIHATIHLHDAVRVGAVGDRGGWGVANVDFTDADSDGTEVTQTFRVLAAWLHEDAGWRIVLTHWSNPK